MGWVVLNDWRIVMCGFVFFLLVFARLLCYQALEAPVGGVVSQERECDVSAWNARLARPGGLPIIRNNTEGVQNTRVQAAEDCCVNLAKEAVACFGKIRKEVASARDVLPVQDSCDIAAEVCGFVEEFIRVRRLVAGVYVITSAMQVLKVLKVGFDASYVFKTFNSDFLGDELPSRALKKLAEMFEEAKSYIVNEVEPSFSDSRRVWLDDAYQTLNGIVTTKKEILFELVTKAKARTAKLRSALSKSKNDVRLKALDSLWIIVCDSIDVFERRLMIQPAFMMVAMASAKGKQMMPRYVFQGFDYFADAADYSVNLLCALSDEVCEFWSKMREREACLSRAFGGSNAKAG